MTWDDGLQALAYAFGLLTVFTAWRHERRRRLDVLRHGAALDREVGRRFHEQHRERVDR